MRALRKPLVFACALVALATPGIAHAGSSLFVGAVENAPLQADLVTAKAKVDLARLAGFDALRLAVFWAPGRASVMPDWDKETLENAAAAAQLSGIRLMVSISNLNSRTTPNTPSLQQELAIYALTIARAYPTITDFIIGNEPNLNTFWMPQFAKPQYKTVTTKRRVKGKLVKTKKKVMKGMPADLAAIGYTNLLATTYDLLKGFNPYINVIGVALSPRGGDNPVALRPTHSPVTFLMDMGAALRKLNRTKPIMDTFAFHPYGETSKIAPTFTHPNSKNIGLGDYTKLVSTLKSAFHGTAQPAVNLPIVYDEFGVQTTIPNAKRGTYTNLGTTTAKDAVSEGVLPAERRRSPFRPRHGRVQRQHVAVGRLLRGRHTEVEPSGRACRGRQSPCGDARELRKRLGNRFGAGAHIPTAERRVFDGRRHVDREDHV